MQQTLLSIRYSTAYLDSQQVQVAGMYIMTSYTPDSEIVPEKNPNYWGESTHVDKYVIRFSRMHIHDE